MYHRFFGWVGALEFGWFGGVLDGFVPLVRFLDEVDRMGILLVLEVWAFGAIGWVSSIKL